MPLQNTLGALTYPKSSFFYTPTSGNGWISIGSSGTNYRGPNGNSGRGTGISIDSGGNVFCAFATGTNTNNGYILKFDSTNGNNIWYENTARGPGIAANTNDVWYSQNEVSTPGGIPTYNVTGVSVQNVGSNISANTTGVSYTGSMTNAYNFPDYYGIKLDNNGAAYTLNGFGLTNQGRIFISDSNHVFRGLGTISGSFGSAPQYYPECFCITPNGNNIYIVGYFTTITDPTVNNQWTLLKLTKTANYTFSQTYRKKISANTYYIAADNSNVFLSTTTGIIKLDSSGNILMRKGSLGADKPLTVDSSGNLFVNNSYGFIKFDANLTPIFENSFEIKNSSGVDRPVGIEVDNTYVYGCSIVNNRQLTYKIPKSGLVPGNGSYRVGPYIVTYTNNANLINSDISTTVTDTTVFGGSITPYSNTAASTGTTSIGSSSSYYQTTV